MYKCAQNACECSFKQKKKVKVPIWGLNPDATVKLGLSLHGLLGFEGEMMQDTGESVLGGLIKFEDGVKQEDLRIQWRFPSKVSGIVRSAIGKCHDS